MQQNQVFMDRIEATKMLLTVFSDTNRNAIRGDLLQKYLDFFIILLWGGNKKVQSSIYTYCLNNHQSEKMFYKFHYIIDSGIQRYKDMYEQKKQNKNVEHHSEQDDELLEEIVKVLKTL
jgi:hypothetical protein